MKKPRYIPLDSAVPPMGLTPSEYVAILIDGGGDLPWKLSKIRVVSAIIGVDENTLKNIAVQGRLSLHRKKLYHDNTT